MKRSIITSAPRRFVLLLITTAACLSLIGNAAADGSTKSDPKSKETFAVVWERLQNSGFTGKHEGLDWNALKAKHQPSIEAAQDITTLRIEIDALLSDLKASHLELIPSEAMPSSGELPKSGNGDTGLRLVLLNNTIVVERVSQGSAAETAGIRPGWTVDQLGDFDIRKLFAKVKAEGRTAKPRGQTILQLVANQMVANVATGTTVKLKLRDLKGSTRALQLIALENKHVQTITLPGLPPMPLRFEQRAVPLANGGCALYVEYSQWAMPVYDQLVDALREYGDCKGVIIDLRGNSGGLIASVTAVGGLFFDTPTSLGTMITSGGDLKLTSLPRIVTVDGRDVRRFSGPLAILTDRASVSCSDIFPGGMQALGRARIFGDTSAGMALPAAAIPLPSGDRLLYPTADFTDPNGRRIEGVGVIPDQRASPTHASLVAGRDLALEAALGWIASPQASSSRTASSHTTSSSTTSHTTTQE